MHFFNVNNNIGHVVQPNDNMLNIYINYLPYQTLNKDMETLFGGYGKVTSIKNIAVRDPRLAGVEVLSDKRLIRLQPFQVTATSLPYQLKVKGDNCIWHIPGRPPRCFR